MKHNRRGRLRGLSFATGAAIGVVLSVGTAARADQIELPKGPGRDLVYGTCRVCHDLQYLVESAGVPRDTWDELLTTMKQFGLRIPDERRAKILDYLGTYLGPNPPKGEEAAAGAAAEAAAEPMGEDLFVEQCSACHQENGAGLKGQFPPLAGNTDLMQDRLFPAYVLLNGLEGKITVKGSDYEAQMPPFGHLTDDQVVSVVEYVRGAWGNAGLRPAAMKPLDAAAVKQVRDNAMSPAQVHAYRAKLVK